MPKISASVLIIRLDAIGDALALTPLLAALRRRGVPADVVLRPTNAAVFSSRAARSIVTADFELRSSAQANLAAIERLGHELHRREYSHVLVATEDPGGYRLAGFVGAPTRIGFTDFWGKPFKALWARRFLTRSVYRSAALDPRGMHECDVLFGLAAPLIGDEPPTHDSTELRPLVLEREPPADDRVAIQITDKWERLGIAFENVVDLVRRVTASGAPHLLSAQREAAYAERVALSTGLPVSYFDQLEPWKAAIGAAAALVTPDSGALHVAGMVGTPVVGVFPRGPDFAMQVARWAPWGAPHRVVRADEGWPVAANEALANLLSS